MDTYKQFSALYSVLYSYYIVTDFNYAQWRKENKI